MPADAEVTIDGASDFADGDRTCVRHAPIGGGLQFQLHRPRRWTANGNPVEKSRKVTFSAGANVRVDFTAN